MDNYIKEKLKKEMSTLIRRKKLEGKRIVLFGASADSREVKNCLAARGLVPHAVIDNDSRKIGKDCMGLVVQRPEDALLPLRDDAAILLISGGYFREMTYQLTEMGYVTNRHIFLLNYRIDEAPPVVLAKLLRAVRGLLTYRRLCKGGQTLFIAPYTGTGDIYLSGLFFSSYLKRKGITNYTFAVVSGACKKTAEMFHIQNIVVLNPKVADDVINCNRFLRAGFPIVVLNDGWGGELLQWIRGYRGLRFDLVFRYFVFGFPDDVPYALPPRRDHGAEIDALFRRYGLAKGKTVVLSPYSNTLFDLPDDFWSAIIDHCVARGYTVCTNCAGDAEPPIPGTEPVFFPLGLAIGFMDAAGYFIGVRSGLCDIISSSACKKVILYEKDGFFYRCSPYEYFSLEKMGLCADALELEYRRDLKERILDQVKRLF